MVRVTEYLFLRHGLRFRKTISWPRCGAQGLVNCLYSILIEIRPVFSPTVAHQRPKFSVPAKPTHEPDEETKPASVPRSLRADLQARGRRRAIVAPHPPLPSTAPGLCCASRRAVLSSCADPRGLPHPTVLAAASADR